MIAGMIGPKGRPGFLHPHRHGVINLVEPRKFVVDPDAERVLDEGSETLVLTTECYDAIRQEIVDGASMFIEPVSGDESNALEDANREIAELRRLREEDEARFESQVGELKRMVDDIRSKHEEMVAELRKELEASATLLAGTQKRIAELEQQLAAADAPAAPAEDKTTGKAKKDK